MNQFYRQPLFFVSILFLFASCSKKPEQVYEKPIEHTTTNVNQLLSSDEFAEKIESLGNEVLVDVRTAQEVEKGKISGAIHIDFRGSEFKSAIGALDRSKPIMVYCAGGGRSGKAAHMLSEMGFKEVYDLKGGYSNWKK